MVQRGACLTESHKPWNKLRQQQRTTFLLLRCAGDKQIMANPAHKWSCFALRQCQSACQLSITHLWHVEASCPIPNAYQLTKPGVNVTNDQWQMISEWSKWFLADLWLIFGLPHCMTLHDTMWHMMPCGSREHHWDSGLNAMPSTLSLRSSGSTFFVPRTRNPLNNARDNTALGVMNLSCAKKLLFKFQTCIQLHSVTEEVSRTYS